MLFLDGVYIDCADKSLVRFRRVKAPTSDELTQLTPTIARRIARYLERQGLLERDQTQAATPADLLPGIVTATKDAPREED